MFCPAKGQEKEHKTTSNSPGAKAAEDGHVPMGVLRAAHDRQVEVQHPLVPHQAPDHARRVGEVTHHLESKLLQPRLLQHAPVSTTESKPIGGGKGAEVLYV